MSGAVSNAPSRLAQTFDPGGEAFGEQMRAVDGVDDVVQRVVAGNPCLEGQQAAEELLMHLAPAPDLDEVLRPGQRSAQHDQQHLGQRKQHLPGLARVFQCGEVVDQRWAGHRETSLTRGLP